MAHPSFLARWLSAGMIALVAALIAAGLPPAPSLAAANTTYTVYNSPASGTAGDIDGSEIVDITPDNRFAVVVGSIDLTERRLYIATLTPTTGIVVGQADLSAALNSVPAAERLTTPVPSSVAVHPTGTYALVTVREGSAASNTATEKPGFGVFVNIAANGTLTVDTTNVVRLGVRPEAVEIAPSGRFAVVAAEGADGQAGSGTIAVVALSASGSSGGSVAVTLTPQQTGPNAPDPEAVAISPDSSRAFVTLQSPGDIAVVSINAANLAASSLATVDLPAAKRPDGIAVTPDSQYLVTANEGQNSVSLYRVGGTGGAPTITLVGDRGVAAGAVPEMVAIGVVGGALEAYVSLEQADAVAVFGIAANGLAPQGTIQLNPGSQSYSAAAYGPEGIAVATLNNGLSYIVTANGGRNTGGQGFYSNNISVIRASTSATQPNGKRTFLPLMFK